MRDAEAAGEVDDAGFAVGVDEISDHLDVILGDLVGMGDARAAVMVGAGGLGRGPGGRRWRGGGTTSRLL